MSDASARMNNSATCTPSDTELAHADSRKVLAKMLKAYETAPAPCKGSLGLFLRKAHADALRQQ